MDKVITSLTVLLTGFVVVFMVLLLLIGIIKLYSYIVRTAEKNARKTKEEKNIKLSKAEDKQPETLPVVNKTDVPPPESEGIPQEIIAVIAAAVDSTYGTGASSRIKSVKKAPLSRNAWGNAGILQNTKPF